MYTFSIAKLFQIWHYYSVAITTITFFITTSTLVPSFVALLILILLWFMDVPQIINLLKKPRVQCLSLVWVFFFIFLSPCGFYFNLQVSDTSNEGKWQQKDPHSYCTVTHTLSSLQYIDLICIKFEAICADVTGSGQTHTRWLYALSISVTQWSIWMHCPIETNATFSVSWWEQQNCLGDLFEWFWEFEIFWSCEILPLYLCF